MNKEKVSRQKMNGKEAIVYIKKDSTPCSDGTQWSDFYRSRQLVTPQIGRLATGKQKRKEPRIHKQSHSQGAIPGLAEDKETAVVGERAWLPGTHDPETGSWEHPSEQQHCS